MASCAFLFGFACAVAQIIVIRELMTVFSGHDLVFAMVLGLWLVGIAIGSAWTLSRGISRAGWAMALGAVVLPLTVIAIRLIKPALGIPPGGMAALGFVMAASAVVLLPVTVILGSAFSFLSREMDGGAVYGHEALGFVAGGVMMTFVFWVPLPHAADAWSRQALWSGYEVTAVQQSRYGALVVAQRGGQKSFFHNGRLMFTQDDPAAEEVHAALLAHPSPRTMFMAGGGFSQAGREALKHPLVRLEYAEIDPQLLRLEAEAAGADLDPRLRLLTGDPRRLLTDAGRIYDVIYFDPGDPVSLFGGRFFTREFFAVAAARLSPGGLFALTISSSENYVNARTMAYARSVRSTLMTAFRHVEVIPGGRMTFIASQAPVALTAGMFVDRLEQRGIKAQFMRGVYLRERMSPARMMAARGSLRSWGEKSSSMWFMAPDDISRDMQPVLVWRALVALIMSASPGFSAMMEYARLWAKVLWCLPLFLVVFVRRPVQRSLPGAAVAGASQMLFQITTIGLVQSVFGHAYAVIGILTAGFMLGAFYGTRCAGRLSVRDWAWVQVALALCFVAMVMPWPQMAFVFPFLAGIAGGAQFAVYAGMAGQGNAGKIYAADVMGAALGALLGGVLLVPLWGMAMTMMFVAALNAVMALALRHQPGNVSAER